MSMSSSFRNTRRHKLKAEINVVPFIDVMLVLLVIFMITVPVIQQSVTVNLVEKSNSGPAKQLPNKKDEIAIEVLSKEDSLIKGYGYKLILPSGATEYPYVSTEDSLPGTMLDAIKQQKSLNDKSFIVLYGDKGAAYGDVLKAFFSLKKMFDIGEDDHGSVKLATQPLKARR